VFSMIVAHGAFVHEHYQLPFIPPAAAIIGKAFVRARPQHRGRRWVATARWFLAGALVVSAVWRYAEVSAMEETAESEPYRLAMHIRSAVEPGGLVVAVDNDDPTDLYHAERLGWSVHADEIVIRGDALLADKAREGARYFAGRYELFADPRMDAALRPLLARQGGKVFDDGQDFIVRIAAPRPVRGRPGVAVIRLPPKVGPQVGPPRAGP